MNRSTLLLRNFGAAAAAALVLGSVNVTTPALADSTGAVNVIRGIVLMPDGSPAQGAAVSLFAVPDVVGDQREQHAFATAETDASGVFSVSIADQAPAFLADALRDNGAFNYLIEVNHQQTGVGGIDARSVTGDFHVGDLSYLPLVDADLTDAISKIGVNPAFQTPPLDVDHTYVLAPLDGTADSVVNTDVGDANKDTCYHYKYNIATVVGRERRMEPVGELHAYYDAEATFFYGATANTELGGAYKVDGKAWSASAGATHAGESGSEVDITIGHHTGRTVRSQFSYRKERIDWYNNGKICRTDYWIIPEGWTGGGIDLHRDVSAGDSGGQFDIARGRGNYLPFGPRSNWRKWEGKGQKYTYDVSAFGVSLHATSGWGNNVDIRWEFGRGDVEHDLYNMDAHPKQARIVYSY